MSSSMRLMIYAVAALSALVAGRRVVESYADDEFYVRDFIQEYVLARALIDRQSPYQPLPELVAAYVPGRPQLPWMHPTPHPPVAAFFCMPLGWLEIHAASLTWLLLELTCLACSIEILARQWGEPVPLATKAALLFLSLSTGPVIRELWLGQFGMFLLVLTLLAWIALRSNRDVLGGLSLGVAMAIKLVGWPILLYLLLRGRWRSVAAAAGIFLALHGPAWLVMGGQPIRDYYTAIGPRVAADNRVHLENFSLWTVGSRCFTSEPITWTNSVVIDTLKPSDVFERAIKFALPVLALMAAVALAWRCQSFDSAYAILLCAGLPLNPVVWDHYLILTALPMMLVARRLAAAGFPRGPTALAVVALAIAVIPRPGDLAVMVRTFGVLDGDTLRVGFVPSLLTYLPLVSLGSWIYLLGTAGETLNEVRRCDSASQNVTTVTHEIS